MDKFPIPATGEVWLVGAGPGDPGLLTLAGWAALNSATVIVHDRLGCEAILALLPEGIRRIDVGKIPYSSDSISQHEINTILLREAAAGNAVVRLKGGDPFVFGRGSEEVEFLNNNGIKTRVIPGISSALAAPAAAGIPVTHRGLARSFSVHTGHTEEGPAAALAAADTQIFLMAVAHAEEITASLLAAGRSPETPATVISHATTPQQRVVRGSLASIARLIRDEKIVAPAVLVIGPTAHMGR
ncbi:hypothetical protein BH09SUM1_BH09SUM1_14260 [soil metagenome]